MRSSIGKIGRRLSVVVVFALAMTGVAAASAGATVPQLEYSLPDHAAVTGGQIVMEATTSTVTCTGTSGTTELTLSKTYPVTLHFTGCTAKVSGIPVGKCTSAGSVEGEITTKSLMTTLEYISKASHEVGMIFNYGGGTSTVASFTCAGGTSGSIRGEFMAKITPINVFSANFPLALNGTKGAPEFTQFENEKGEKVTLSTLEIGIGGTFKKANFSATELSLGFSNAARIKA